MQIRVFKKVPFQPNQNAVSGYKIMKAAFIINAAWVLFQKDAEAVAAAQLSSEFIGYTSTISG
jgi:hypothetical protein